MDAVRTLEGEVRELIRRSGLDPARDETAVRRLVREAVADYDERSLLGGMPVLSEVQAASRAVWDTVAGYGPLQQYVDDPSVEKIWVDERLAPGSAVGSAVHLRRPPARGRQCAPRGASPRGPARSPPYDGGVDETGAAGRGTAPVRSGEPAAGRHWWAGQEDSLPAGLQWLSARERTRFDAMRFTKRRNEFLLRRWVGKRTVAARVGLDVAEASLARIEVLNRITGAPYVLIEGAAAPWEISLSDRAGTAVALIGPVGGSPGTLGIDLELVERRSEGFVTDFLTRAEQEWVKGAATQDPRLGQDAAANLVWSAKESALKVLHLGLRADTRWVEVTLGSTARDDGWARFTAVWRGVQVIPGWWRRDGSYLLTVADEVDLDPPRVLPGAVEMGLATPVHSWVDRPVVTPGE